MSQDDHPLSDNFYQNPLEYMQNHVRNLNNELFLSQYHINNLYALLLIGRTSPWDTVKGSNPGIKDQIDHLVNQKVHDVKAILQSLSNMYEDKSKKSAITQIERLMGILKSKRKSIFIEKDRQSPSFKQFQTLKRMAQELEHSNKQKSQQTRDKEQTVIVNEAQNRPSENNQNKQNQKHQNTIQVQNKQKQAPQVQHQQHLNGQTIQKQKQQIPSEPIQQIVQENNVCTSCHHHKDQEKKEQLQEKGQVVAGPSHRNRDFGGKQVFSIFYGLSNMSNLTALALSNILQYSSVDRFIKFKMSQSYIMTIKSEDPFQFDTSSRISKVPPEIFTNHIFPYLTASELFRCRSVCKQWLDYVKESWHSTFKRQMFVQLLACQFCKDIEFYYKTIQLRNPFFQKISLLIHALIEILNWEIITASITANTLTLQLKRVLMILLRLIGEQVPFTNLNSITDAFFNQHKDKLINLKAKVGQFFSSLSGSDLSVNELRTIKTQFLDDHFMRVQEINTEDKTPLLLNLLVKQITLQQILRNHIYLAQQYLLNTKRRLDNLSSKMVYHKGYLEGVYKILLLKSTDSLTTEGESNQLPNLNDMIQSIFKNQSCQKPDFVLRNKHSTTEIYLDSATKLDIILSTVCSLNQRTDNAQNEPQQQQISHQQEGQAAKCEEIVFIRQEEAVVEPQKEQKVKYQTEKQKKQIVNAVDIKIDCSQQTPSYIQQSQKKECSQK